MNEQDLKDIHELSHNNKELVGRSQLVGCFYCGEIFSTKDIEEWWDEGKTAVCPHCGIDSVLPDTMKPTLTIELLHEMYDYWFGCTSSLGNIVNLKRSW